MRESGVRFPRHAMSGKWNAKVCVITTGSNSAMRMQCDAMLCSEMQCINSVTPGTRNQENNPGCVLLRVSSKAGKLRRVANDEDATLSNTRTRGSNPRCAMSV